MKNKKRTGLEETAIYNFDHNCYHLKSNLIVKKLWWKMIQKPIFNFEKFLINKVLHQYCPHLK